eukprot:CAMPEP_0113956982 /NCGR_PEP_ID=MMETSP0011_2-20120614/2426_1 /TAXON_ID=101924 /ORGANISM="Rhodosorus marinus" /LENGTH=283 /DNA_ID=CAMNT_0000967313 /DNA_START=187 /DNA_END=1038 /DNA_ORIENTATION=+ /assembly_acc=CAM_ASM_000156
MVAWIDVMKVSFIGLGGGYLTLLGAVVAAQRRLIWMRPKEVARPTFGQVRVLSRTERRGTRANHVAMLHVPPARAELPTFVHFHGNADQIGWGPEDLARTLKANFGYGFLSVEYPGYGMASDGGYPSEKSAYSAAQRALEFLTDAEGLMISNENLVLIGESIGCGVAVEMAKRGFGRKLILIAPFLSLRSLILKILPMYLTWPVFIFPALLFDKFDNARKIKEVKIPSCIIHGDRDEIIPFSQGQELASIASSASFRTVKGGMHNDLFDKDELYTYINEFLER